MDAALLDSVGGLIVAILGSGGGRVLYVRSRNAHQKQAMEAERRAILAYDDFGELHVAVADSTEVFAGTLGPQSATSYREDVRDDLARADRLDADYTAYTEAGKVHDPRDSHRRSQYIAMTRAYSKFAKRLASSAAKLTTIRRQCESLQTQVAGVADTRAAVAALLTSAREVVGVRQDEGWLVDDLRELLSEAVHWLAQSDAALASSEHLLGIDDLAEAQKLASQARDLALGISARQHRILAQCDAFMRRADKVPTAITKASAALQVAVSVYADACTDGFEATLVAAEALRSGIAAQVAELRRVVQPDVCDWDEADALIDEIGGDLDDIERECTAIRGLKARLDEQMASVRRRGRELLADIAQVEANARNRDGDQRGVFAALRKLGAEVDTLLASFSQPRPNPIALADQVDRLSYLIERIERQSSAIDDDDDDDFEDIVGAVIGGAAAAIGLDLLLGN